MTTTTLRPWVPADRATGLALFDSNVPEFFAAEERKDFIEFLEDLPGPYFVLETSAGEAVGCGGFATKDNDLTTVVLCWGMIRADLHRVGLGRKLLTERLAAIAAEPCHRRVTIETTQHSRGFFARHGFVRTEHVVDGFAPGHDLVKMAMELENLTATTD